MVALMERVGAPGGHRRPRRRQLGMHAVPDPDHRLDDRARGEDRRATAPKIARVIYNRLFSACRCRSTPRCSTAQRSARHDPAVRRAAGDRHAVQHVPARRACRRRRSPTPGGRRSRPRCNPAPNPSPGDPLCAGLPADAVPSTCTTCSPTRTATTRSPRRSSQHDANVAAAAGRRRPDRVIAGADPAGRGDRLAGRATACRRRCTTPAFAAAGSTGRTSPSTSRPGAARPPLDGDADARHRRAVGDDAAQGGRRRGGRRARPGGGRAARGQHRGARSTTAACVGAQHRRRRLRRLAAPRPASTSPGARVVRARRRRRGAVDRRRARPRRRRRRHRRQPVAPTAAEAAAALAGDVGRVGDARRRRRAPTSSSTPRRRDGRAASPRAAARPGRCCTPARSSPTSSTTRWSTPLLAAARAAGARTVDGLGMLVHQAALQQQLWTGRRPDVAVMRAAAEAELARRATSESLAEPARRVSARVAHGAPARGGRGDS